MSSWKSTDKMQQRAHRERSQVSSRKQFGLLEKKKDYKERARNFEEKKNTLKKLRKKALNKNPDEFYFHMINSKVEDGEHHEKETVEEYTEEELKLMQTQDMNYVNMRRAREAQKVEKLKSQMHLLDVEEKPKNTHTFFVDSNEEVRNFDLAKRLDTNLALLGRSYNRPRLSQLKQMSLAVSDVDHLERVMEARNKKYKELNQRVEREKKLDLITRKMEIKKYLMDKKNPPLKKVKAGTKDAPPIYKWKEERKR